MGLKTLGPALASISDDAPASGEVTRAVSVQGLALCCLKIETGGDLGSGLSCNAPVLCAALVAAFLANSPNPPTFQGGGGGSAVDVLSRASVEGLAAHTTLSEQSLVDCSWPFGNQGCDGGEDDMGFLWILDR